MLEVTVHAMLIASGKNHPNLIHTKLLFGLQWSSKKLSDTVF
jgi:hypothetical protein